MVNDDLQSYGATPDWLCLWHKQAVYSIVRKCDVCSSSPTQPLPCITPQSATRHAKRVLMRSPGRFSEMECTCREALLDDEDDAEGGDAGQARLHRAVYPRDFGRQNPRDTERRTEIVLA